MLMIGSPGDWRPTTTVVEKPEDLRPTLGVTEVSRTKVDEPHLQLGTEKSIVISTDNSMLDRYF